MRVRICQPLSGSLDGIRLDEFRAGSTYALGMHIASAFVAQGWAEPAARGDDLSSPVRPPIDPSALVLVVDDEPAMRDLTTTLLALNGYDVVDAAHGADGIARLHQHIPDLVILDVNMPVMDGWEFCAELHGLDGCLGSVPILLLTGADGAQRQAAKLKVRLLHKPCDPDRLLQAVEEALGKRLQSRGTKPKPWKGDQEHHPE
jgi:CheY-like chemotaxis protein